MSNNVDVGASFDQFRRQGVVLSSDCLMQRRDAIGILNASVGAARQQEGGQVDLAARARPMEQGQAFGSSVHEIGGQPPEQQAADQLFATGRRTMRTG